MVGRRATDIGDGPRPITVVWVPAVWPIVQTGTPTPTPTLTAEGGLGAAVWLLFVFLVAAIVVTAGGGVVAGWAALTGGFLGLEVTQWQRRVFGVSAVCFGLALGTVFLGFGPTTTVAFYSLLGIAGLTLVVGTLWVFGATLHDRLRETG